MTAATQDRDLREVHGRSRGIPIEAGAKLFGGTMAAINTSGRLVKAATSTTLKVVGVALQAYDNTTGAAGAITGEAVRGTYGPFANSASTDQITAADLEATCYVVDDQTVAKTDGGATRVKAGTVHAVEAAGVWVRF